MLTRAAQRSGGAQSGVPMPPVSPPRTSVRHLDVLAANFKRRHTGVTSTVVALLPIQAKNLRIAALGPGLPDSCPHASFLSLLRYGWSRPTPSPGNATPPATRIWHARRNNELLVGWLLRSVLRMKLRLVFTSAAQRDHTRWTKFLLRRADGVIATSPESASFLKVPHVINMHGIDPAVYFPPDDRAAAWAATGLPGRFGVGIFGRVRSQKGTDRFVDAMLALLPRYPDFTAVIVGAIRPDQRRFAGELQSRIAAAGLNDRIRFLGEVAPHEVPLWQRRMTLIVSPQRWEGFGLVPAEAMASGAAVVATRVGAAAHLIDHGKTGYLVASDDMTALAAHLNHLMSHPDEAAAMGRCGRNHVLQNFTIQREAAGIQAMYHQVWTAPR
jgi:mannosyltransferase